MRRNLLRNSFWAVGGIALLISVYRETGPMTTLAFGVVAIYIEAHNAQHVLERANKALLMPISEILAVFRTKKAD